MINYFLKISQLSILLLTFSSFQVFAQGIPTFDTAQFTQWIIAIQNQVKDAKKQFQQIQELKKQTEQQIKQLTNLEGILGSLSGVNEIGQLLNSAKDIASRAEKIGDFSGMINAIRVGDIKNISALFQNQDTMGSKWNAHKVDESLKSMGLSTKILSKLSSSDNPTANGIATQAATSVMTVAAADIAYQESIDSIERVDTLRAKIGTYDTMKEAVDLNTRMTAEVGYIMGQMWRVNAAQSMSTGQNGLGIAADMAREQKLFDFSGGGINE